MKKVRSVRAVSLPDRVLEIRPGTLTVAEFRDLQLEVFDETLAAFSLRCIIGANAKASDVVKDRYSLQFDPSVGCYSYRIKGKATPVFLSGHFTGGALDKYSLERLFWHIDSVLKQ